MLPISDFPTHTFYRSLIHVDLMFVEVEHYADVSRDWRYGIPDKYKYRVEILYHGDYKMGPSYYGNYGKIWTEGEGVNKQ